MSYGQRCRHLMRKIEMLPPAEAEVVKRWAEPGFDDGVPRLFAPRSAGPGCTFSRVVGLSEAKRVAGLSGEAETASQQLDGSEKFALLISDGVAANMTNDELMALVDACAYGEEDTASAVTSDPETVKKVTHGVEVAAHAIVARSYMRWEEQFKTTRRAPFVDDQAVLLIRFLPPPGARRESSGGRFSLRRSLFGSRGSARASARASMRRSHNFSAEHRTPAQKAGAARQAARKQSFVEAAAAIGHDDGDEPTASMDALLALTPGPATAPRSSGPVDLDPPPAPTPAVESDLDLLLTPTPGVENTAESGEGDLMCGCG